MIQLCVEYLSNSGHTMFIEWNKRYAPYSQRPGQKDHCFNKNNKSERSYLYTRICPFFECLWKAWAETHLHSHPESSAWVCSGHHWDPTLSPLQSWFTCPPDAKGLDAYSSHLSLVNGELSLNTFRWLHSCLTLFFYFFTNIFPSVVMDHNSELSYWKVEVVYSNGLK